MPLSHTGNPYEIAYDTVLTVAAAMNQPQLAAAHRWFRGNRVSQGHIRRLAVPGVPLAVPAVPDLVLSAGGLRLEVPWPARSEDGGQMIVDRRLKRGSSWLASRAVPLVVRERNFVSEEPHLWRGAVH